MAISARINWGVLESTNLKNRKEILVAIRLGITGKLELWRHTVTDFLTANSVNISYNQDSKTVSINNQYVKMFQPSVTSNLVDIFSATLNFFSNKCKNVTRNPSAKILSDVPAHSLPETLPEIPPDFSQNGSQMTSSDYLTLSSFLIIVLGMTKEILQ